MFQRTAAWLLPTPDYHDAVPDGLGWLFAHCPLFAAGTGFWLFWRMTEGMLDAACASTPTGTHPEHSVSAAERAGCAMLLTGYIEAESAATPATFSKMLPDYPPLLEAHHPRQRPLGPPPRRATMSTLETTGIERITPDRCGRRRRHRARGRRHHLRHRVRGLGVPDADEGHRAETASICTRTMGWRRSGLSGNHRAQHPQLLHDCTARTPTSWSTAASSSSRNAKLTT